MIPRLKSCLIACFVIFALLCSFGFYLYRTFLYLEQGVQFSIIFEDPHLVKMQRETLQFLHEFETPDLSLDGITSPNASNIFDSTASVRKKTPIQDILEYTEHFPDAFPPGWLKDFSPTSLIENLVPLGEFSLDSKLPVKIPNIRMIREAAPYWYYNGRLIAHLGHPEVSMRLFIGIGIMGLYTERATKGNGVFQLPVGMSHVCYNLGAEGLIDVLDDLEPDKRWALIVFKWLQRLEAKMATPDMLVRDQAVSFQAIALWVNNSDVEHRGGELKPCGFSWKVAHRGLLDNRVADFYEPLIQKGSKNLPSSLRLANNLEKRFIDEGEYWREELDRYKIVQLFLRPDYALSESLFFVSHHFSVSFFYHRHLRTVRTLRMAGIIYLIHGYYNSNGKWPTSLDKVGDWFGEKLPTDPFSEKPFDLVTSEQGTLSLVGTDLDRFSLVSEDFSIEINNLPDTSSR